MKRQDQTAFGPMVMTAVTLSFGCVGVVQTPGGPGAGAQGGTGLPRDPGTPDPPMPPDLPGAFNPGFACTYAATPVATELRRLSRDHLIVSLEDFMSRMTAAGRAAVLAALQDKLDLVPADAGAYRSYDTSVLEQHVTALLGVAKDLSGRLAASDAYVQDLVVVCGAGSNRASLADDICLTKFVDYYARKALRRPAAGAERDELKAFYRSQGLASLLARLLMNPRFYYLLDNEGEQISGTAGTDAAYKLTKYELLARMTFVFWNRPPTDELYDAVQGLDFSAAGAVEQMLEQVLANDLARNGIRAFYTEWLRLDGIPILKGNSKPAFKNFTQGMDVDGAQADHRGDMIREVLDMGEHYTFNKGNVADLLTSTSSFARTPALAQIYGAPVWDGSAANLVPFPAAEPRAGLLTRGAMLLSGTEYTRPVMRGKAVRMAILCEEIPEPPADVVANFITLTPDVNKTGRQILSDAMMIEPRCNSCHAAINPLGYLLEGYDALGRHRTEELKFDPVSGAPAGTLPIDTTAVAGLFDGDTEMLSGAVELGERIAGGGQGQFCAARNFFRYAHSRDPAGTSDDCGLEAMWKWAFASGGSLLDMAREATRWPSFRVRLGPN